MTPRSVATLLAITLTIVVLPAQETSRTPAAPVDPITAILDAFRSHSIVALGEGAHGNLQGHAFRLTLVRDPRFAALVNDVIVETGSARYQSVMDRFVRGEDVPEGELRAVREDTVTPTPAWDRAIYDEFFRAVRDVNRALPPERQLRVLLGDPPIDWAAVRGRDDYLAWLRQRDSHPAELIQREVLAKRRRALVIYGDGHFQARTERPARSLTALIEAAGTKTFIVTSTFAPLETLQRDVSSWRTPSLAVLRGTAVGAAPYEMFFGPAPPIAYFRANPRIEDHYDAVLYLGPSSSLTMAPLSYPRCADRDYVEMRVARMVLSGSSPAVADRLKQECAAAAPSVGPGPN